MTKKTEAAPDHSQAAPAEAKSLSPAEVAALIATGTAAELVALFEGQAKANLANKKGEPTKPPKVLIKASRRIRRIKQKNPALYAAFEAGGFNLNTFAAIGTLGDKLAAAVKPTPPDRRTAKLLTPDQKQFVTAAANRVGKAIDAVAPIARALGQDASDVGRASDIRDSADNVRDAIQKVLTATDLLPLLDAAGVGPAYRAVMASDFAKLEEILDAKEDRISDRSNQGKSIVEAAAALEVALLFFRGLSHSRLAANAAMLGEALKYLPRSPERRKAAATGGADEETEDEEDSENDDEEQAKDREGKGGKADEEEKKAANDEADQTGKDGEPSSAAPAADAAASPDAGAAKKSAGTKKAAAR